MYIASCRDIYLKSLICHTHVINSSVKGDRIGSVIRKILMNCRLIKKCNGVINPRVNYLGMLPPPGSTQPCIPPVSLNRVPASAGVKAGKSPLLGGR